MKTELTALITFAAALLPSTVRAEGVKVEHPGVNNTAVRVEGDARYVVLPVQESNDDARINVLVDGHTAQTLYVRLAKSKTDYTVPLRPDALPRARGDTRRGYTAGPQLGAGGEGGRVLGGHNACRQLRHHGPRGALPPGLSPHTTLRVDERPQRHGLRQWDVAPVLSMESLRVEVAGEHDLGPLHEPRPGALGASPGGDRAQRAWDSVQRQRRHRPSRGAPASARMPLWRCIRRPARAACRALRGAPTAARPSPSGQWQPRAYPRKRGARPQYVLRSRNRASASCAIACPRP